MDAATDRRGVRPVELMRDAITPWVRGEKKQDESDRLLRRICKFIQTALDIVIRENHLEQRDRIVAATDNRMLRHHSG